MQDAYDQPNDVREQLEADRRWELVRRRHRLFGFLLVMLIVFAAGLGWLAWRAYPEIQRHETSIQRLPGVQASLAALDQRLSDSDSKLANWWRSQEDLRVQLDRSSHDLRTRIDATGKKANDAAAAMFERVQQQLANQVDGIKTRLAKLESSRDSDQAQIAKLQQELGQVRSQLAEQARDQANELAAVRGQVDQNASTSEQQLTGLQQTQQHDRKDFDTYTDKVAMRRVEFEVAKNHSTEVLPGISVGVDTTDVSFQKTSGWVWIMPDRHTVWLRQLKVQEPVLLNATPDGRRRELVITRVNKNSVVGYVVVPAADSGRS